MASLLKTSLIATTHAAAYVILVIPLFWICGGFNPLSQPQPTSVGMNQVEHGR